MRRAFRPDDVGKTFRVKAGALAFFEEGQVVVLKSVEPMPSDPRGDWGDFYPVDADPRDGDTGQYLIADEVEEVA